MHRMQFHWDSGQTSAVKTKHGLGDDLVEPQSRHPSIREVQGKYKGSTREVQGIHKGPTRSQHRSNTGATRLLQARRMGVSRIARARVNEAEGDPKVAWL